MTERTREEIDAMTWPVVLEFGASWCPYCKAIQRYIADSLAKHSSIQHIQIEDGKRKLLGRTFRVKLWPTQVFMCDGQILHAAVGPSRSEIDQGFRLLVS